jgi:ankyrin repeat protein
MEITDKIIFNNHPLEINEFYKYVENKIQLKEDLNQKDNDGYTLLMIISKYSNDNYLFCLLQKIIKAGVNINLQDNEGWTALMFASKYSNDTSSLKTVKELIKAGAYLNLQNNKGWTALMYASRHSNDTSSLETVKELIKSGANINLQSINGNTALLIASNCVNNSSSIETVKELIKSWSRLNLENNHGNNCLAPLVRYSNSLELIQDVISRGVSINNLTKNIKNNHDDYNYNGNSLLHWCAIGILENTSSYKILKYLETFEIDKKLKNQENKTYKDYLPNIDIINYYISTICNICYQSNEYFTILNCKCKCGRFCINCTKIINTCCYCKEEFNGYKIIKFV